MTHRCDYLCNFTRRISAPLSPSSDRDAEVCALQDQLSVTVANYESRLGELQQQMSRMARQVETQDDSLRRKSVTHSPLQRCLPSTAAKPSGYHSAVSTGHLCNVHLLNADNGQVSSGFHPRRGVLIVVNIFVSKSLPRISFPQTCDSLT